MTERNIIKRIKSYKANSQFRGEDAIRLGYLDSATNAFAPQEQYGVRLITYGARTTFGNRNSIWSEDKTTINIGQWGMNRRYVNPNDGNVYTE